MSSNISPRRPRRGTALTAALAMAAIGGPFAATAVIIAEQQHATSSTTSTVSTRNPSGQPGVSAGSGKALTVSSGSSVQSTTNGGAGVGSGSGPAYTVSSGS